MLISVVKSTQKLKRLQAMMARVMYSNLIHISSRFITRVTNYLVVNGGDRPWVTNRKGKDLQET